MEFVPILGLDCRRNIIAYLQAGEHFFDMSFADAIMWKIVIIFLSSGRCLISLLHTVGPLIVKMNFHQIEAVGTTAVFK